MKKVLLVVTSAIVLMSCGGKGKSDAKGDDTKSSSSVSAPMQAFMGKLDGNAMNTEAALKEYGKEGLETAGMEMYDLKDPAVKETNGNCYLLECKSGVTKRKYNVCWEADKISSVEDKGME